MMFNAILGLIAAAATPAVPAVPAAPETTAAAPQAAPASADKIRCKRYTETGSLAVVRKECHTEKEWRALAEQGNREASRLLNSGANSSRGPQ